MECVAARERLASKKAADTPKQSRAPPPPPATPPPSVDEFPNHYATLGVPEFTAALPEIKKAYHKLALKYHPDKVASRM